MGVFCRLGQRDLKPLSDLLNITFDGEANGPTLHIVESVKVACLFISSGSLIRPSPSHGYVDSVAIGLVGQGKRLNVKGITDTLSSLTSTFFSLVPFVQRDRPPRTLIAAIQSNQAISLPYTGQGNTALPCYSSVPIVRTELMDRVVRELKSSASPATVVSPWAGPNSVYS